MTDKMTRNESNKRHKGSIVERVAKRVSSDLSADIAREDTLPGNGVADAAPETPGGSRPAAGLDTTTATRAGPAGSRRDLNLSRLSAAGYITPDAARSRVMEEYRLIKRTILNRHRNGASPHSNLILITSALPDEGKTFTTINLAISMAAEEDLAVMLIDADFNKPGAIAVLGCHIKIGLVDVLVNPDIDLADVLVKTNLPNLTILPAGQSHGHSTELLAGARMAQLAEEMASRYENRFIIFDCPPLLATTEAAALTAHVGQVLFVVRAESTKEAAVRQALELIDEKPEVGLILNRSRSRIGSSEFGDYYGSYGDYGYGSQKPG
jgi:exopolysaccharide/PEP-CTERM locus tyrosine autokinase